MHNNMFSLSPKTIFYITEFALDLNCLLMDGVFDFDSTYFCAGGIGGQARVLKDRLLVRSKLKQKSKQGGFHRIRKLDYKAVIDWFEKSGLL